MGLGDEREANLALARLERDHAQEMPRNGIARLSLRDSCENRLSVLKLACLKVLGGGSQIRLDRGAVRGRLGSRRRHLGALESGLIASLPAVHRFDRANRWRKIRFRLGRARFLVMPSIAIRSLGQPAERLAQRAQIGFVVFPMSNFVGREPVADRRRVKVKAAERVYSGADVSRVSHQVLVAHA